MTAHRETTAAPEIVEALELDIILGRIHPRQRLIEDDLMERYDLTRHRARRVIQEIVARGFAVHEPNKGAHVRSYSRREVLELYEMRDTLQTRAIELMPLPFEAERIARLTEEHEAHLTAGAVGDVVSVIRHNNAFHDLFFDACPNRLMVEAIGTFTHRTHQVRTPVLLDRVYLAKAQAEHAQIIEAATAGDRQRLIALSRLHTTRPRDAFLASMPPVQSVAAGKG